MKGSRLWAALEARRLILLRSKEAGLAARCLDLFSADLDGSVQCCFDCRARTPLLITLFSLLLVHYQSEEDAPPRSVLDYLLI
jgi:hypothetical protein